MRTRRVRKARRHMQPTHRAVFPDARYSSTSSKARRRNRFEHVPARARCSTAWRRPSDRNMRAGHSFDCAIDQHRWNRGESRFRSVRVLAVGLMRPLARLVGYRSPGSALVVPVRRTACSLRRAIIRTALIIGGKKGLAMSGTNRPIAADLPFREGARLVMRGIAQLSRDSQDKLPRYRLRIGSG